MVWRLREGLLSSSPEDLENGSKISVFGQPRQVVCTGELKLG
jgi:hypothetical protein